MSERYFEDFSVGERFETGAVTLTDSMIIDFALTYDPQPFHIDREAAAASPFGGGGIIASGFQTIALGFRMFMDSRVLAACSIGSPGMDDVQWLAPVRPDDTIHTVAEVMETRESKSKPDRGTLRMRYTIVNQRGEDVARMTAIQIVRRRPKP